MRITRRKEKGHALLSVMNDGEEIPPEQQKHLFERFYRTDEARTGEDGHYGLGLAIARAIAHKPKVLFADEPTAELDTTTGLQVVKIFKELTQSEGVTIIMTTHDTGLMEIGDLAYELEDGEILHG